LKLRVRKKLLRVFAIALIVLIAGPEIGIGIELFAVLDIMGAELFVLSFAVGIRMLPIWGYFEIAHRKILVFDPYFFVPTLRHLRECPGLVAHALPGFMVTYLCLVEFMVPSVDI